MAKPYSKLKLVILLLGGLPFATFGLPENVSPQQTEFEKSSEAVVRNKIYYKPKKYELGVHGGLFPYDSLINCLYVGARVTWHFKESMSWEILDGQYAFTSMTAFSTGLTSDKGLANLQVLKPTFWLASNFIFTPFYSKIRFFGSEVVYFDLAVLAGIGLAKTDTVQLSTTAAGGAVTQATVNSQFDPMIDAGILFKFFIGKMLSLNIDLRDYLTYSRVYGVSALRNNYGFNVGLSVFFPKFMN